MRCRDRGSASVCPGVNAVKWRRYLGSYTDRQNHPEELRVDATHFSGFSYPGNR